MHYAPLLSEVVHGIDDYYAHRQRLLQGELDCLVFDTFATLCPPTLYKVDRDTVIDRAWLDERSAGLFTKTLNRDPLSPNVEVVMNAQVIREGIPIDHVPVNQMLRKDDDGLHVDPTTSANFVIHHFTIWGGGTARFAGVQATAKEISALSDINSIDCALRQTKGDVNHSATSYEIKPGRLFLFRASGFVDGKVDPITPVAHDFVTKQRFGIGRVSTISALVN